jgi:hypothetical protein
MRSPQNLVGVLLLAALAAAPLSAQMAAPTRDGRHDFDFLNGRWTLHLKRMLHPLTGDTTWVEYDGTAQARSIMGGLGQIDEFDANDPTTHQHLAGLTLRLYNTKTGEWSLYYANAANGKVSLPPTVGHFTNGRGEFYDHEEYNGRPIIVRFIWSDITPQSARFEQAFSADGGKTWETNWIYTCQRVGG